MNIFYPVATIGQRFFRAIRGGVSPVWRGKYSLKADSFEPRDNATSALDPTKMIPKRGLITSENIQKINQLKGKERLQYILDVMWKLDPPQLKPQIGIIDNSSFGSGLYNPISNRIFITSKCLEYSNDLVGLIAHEVQHCRQLITILRSDEMAPTFIKKYADAIAANKAKMNKERLRKMPKKEFEKMISNLDEDDRNEHLFLRYGDIKDIEKTYRQMLVETFEKRRKLIRSIIPLDLLEYEKPYAKAYMKRIFNPVEDMKKAEYWSQFAEQEACWADRYYQNLYNKAASK